jgi:outer membrane lipoprotein-sorting protein
LVRSLFWLQCVAELRLLKINPTMSILPILAAVSALQTPTISDYCQTGLQDLSFTTRIVKADQDELKKVNRDFGMMYRFDTVKVQAKEPFKLRLDASVEDTTLLYLVNGTTQWIRAGRLHIDQKTDLADRPGRRQTIFDFGILTPSLFDSYLDAKFVRMDRATGDPVFDVTYQDKNDHSRSRVWVDPQRKIISKREWYNQQDRELATFYYLNPIQTDGVWMPTRVEVKNVDDRVAGVTQYGNVHVNAGISDDRFSVR